MTTILRNLNNNSIKVIYFPKKKTIRKITFNKKYYKYLDNEIKGLNWYSKIENKKNNLIKYHKRNNFFFLDLKFFDGNKNIFYRSIVKNKNIISRSISYYKKIWPQKKIVKCHGDLTIDNIIYDQKNIMFIDWELFDDNGAPWGYDLVYLLISSIYFPYKLSNSINDKEKIIFKKLWSKLKDLKITNKILNDPIKFFLQMYKKKKWQQIIIDHPKKIYPIWINKNFTKILKELIL